MKDIKMDFEAAEYFTNHIDKTKYKFINKETLEKTKIFLLDTIGVGIAGSTGSNLKELKSVVTSWSKGTGCTILGTGESVSNGYSDMQLIIVDTVDGNKTLVYSKIEDTIRTPVLNSIENNYVVNKIDVFPNPVMNELFIQSHEEIFKIDVFSVNRTHISVPIFINSGLSKIDTRTLPQGLYFIKIEFNEQVINRKFLKH